MKRTVFVLLAFFAATFARAASPAAGLPTGLDRDLGQGLVYHRVHHVPADLPTAESARKQPCVLDLRYVHGDADAATALAGWLRFHASARVPVIVLANADTSAELLAPVDARAPIAGVVVIGIATEGFVPDIALKVSSDTERKAYDALENGASLDALLNDSPAKLRNDEARLAKEHQSDAGPDDVIAPDKPARSAPPPAAPVIDAALQRAVQLHRTLVALKKI